MTARHTFPPFDWTNLQGMFTKTNRDLLEATQLLISKNTDYFTEYGSVRKIRGNKRILSAIYKEAGIAQPISWIGYYKHNDFAGQLHRDVLIAAGTTIQKVNSDGSLTEMATGQPSGLYRDSDQFGRYLLITGQNQFKTGERGDFLKYDGFKISNWGVEAPGNQETIIDAYDSVSGFTVNGCTLALDSDIAWSGTAAKMTMNVGATVGKFDKTYSAFSVINTIEHRASLRLYIPETQFRKLARSGRCVSIYFGSDGAISLGPHSWVRYDFRIGQLRAGWNLLSFDFSVFPSGDLGTSWLPGSFDDQNIDIVRCEVLVDSAAATSADACVVYWDHLVTLDAGAPTPTGTSPNVNGIFQAGDGQVWSYKVTFETENGVESNAGPESIEWDLSGEDGIAEDIVRLNYDSAGLYSTNGGTNSLSTDTTNFTENGASVSLNKADNTTVNGDIIISGQSLDFQNIINNLFKIDLYIPTSARANLANVACEIYLADSSSLNNYLKFNVNADDLEEGDFTTITKDVTTPDLQVGVVDLTAVDTVIVRWITKDATTTQNNLKADNLRVDVPSSFDEISLSDIPVSTDPAVTKRNLYRTVANGTTWLYLASINDNVTTTYVDTISDGALGSATPPEAGQFFDASKPPNCSMIKVWKRTVFMAGDPQNPTLLYFSLDDNPDAFPLINAFEFDSPITGIFETRLGLIVTTETDHWRVIGDNPDYFVDRVLKGMGNVGFRACNEARLFGWAHDRDGIRLYDLVDTNKISEPIRNKIDELDQDNLKDAWTIHSQRLNMVLAFYKNSSGVYDTSYVYQYPIDNIREGWIWELDFPSSLEFICGAEIEDSNSNKHLYVGGNDGMLYELFADDSDNWTLADGSQEAIEMELQSIPLRLGPVAAEFQGVTGRWKPFLTELRARDANSKAHNWELRVDTMDGSGEGQKVLESYTQTFAFPREVTFQRYGDVYKNVRHATFVQFTLKNSDLDVDVYFQGLRAYVHAKSGQDIVEGDGPGGRA